MLQILSTRARKDVKVEDIKVRVCIFAFDCLYFNGKTLLQEPLTERRAALLDAVLEKHGELQIATAKVGTHKYRSHHVFLRTDLRSTRLAASRSGFFLDYPIYLLDK